MEKRFKVLRIIGGIYRVLGWITAGLTVLSALGVCLIGLFGGGLLSQMQQQFGQMGGPGGMGVMGGALGGILAGAGILVYGAVMTLLFLGTAEGIDLLLALEENTRATADYLQRYTG